MSELAAGLSGTSTQVVTDADTAVAFGSGDVSVYATPALTALFERAAVAALHGVLPSSQTSVGTTLELEHVAPSLVGATVRATARLTTVAGRRLTFACEAHDGDRLVGRCTHQRAIVERATFPG